MTAHAAFHTCPRRFVAGSLCRPSARRELRPLLHGEYLIVLANGTEITSGRSYRLAIQDAFGLGRAPVVP